MATITFVRHGITNNNIEHRAQGHLNNPLNETGFQQAELVARRLAEESWDVLISSDLLRARQTAEIVSKSIGLPIAELDVRLREMDQGRLENTTEGERISMWGFKWNELEHGVEKLESLRERGLAFVEDIAQRYAGRKVLVVTHGFFLGQTLKALMGDESTGDSLQNTSVTTIAHKGERWHYLLYDCVRHLEPNKAAADQA
jgi:probable phosphoglycerate mutase